MKKIFLIFSMLLIMGLTSIIAQDYVGTYSGTLTFTPTVFPLEDSLLNTQIENQILQISEDVLFFPEIQVLKVGEPYNIGFPDPQFLDNDVISAPPVQGTFSEIEFTMTLTSGTILGNTVSLSFRMTDNATGGQAVDVSAEYTGTKQENIGINEISADTNKTIVGYYSIIGQQLSREPQSGLYVVVYDNGTSEKVMKE